MFKNESFTFCKWFFTLLFIIVIQLPVESFAWCPSWWFGCLDTDGRAAPTCKYTCEITGVNLDEKTTNRTNYFIVTRCDWQASSGAAACPPSNPKLITGTAWWDETLNMAYENIHNTYTDEFLVDTVSKCSENPWTEQVDCTEIQRNVISNVSLPTAPISARKMTAANKTLLAQQEAVATTAAQAPYFLQPAMDSEFENPASVEIKVRHLAQYQPEFELQYKNWMSHQFVGYPIENMTVDSHPVSVEGDKATTLAVYQANKEGYYRIRVRCKAADAKWSDFIPFTVTSPQSAVIVEPSENEKFKVKANVTVRATHHPNYSVNFSFKWSPRQEPGEWPVASIDTEPFSTGVKISNNGETHCSYSFDKPGLYRVYAHFADNPASVSSQSFEIVELTEKALEKKKPLLHSLSPTVEKKSTDIRPIVFKKSMQQYVLPAQVRVEFTSSVKEKLDFEFAYRKKGRKVFRPVINPPAFSIQQIDDKTTLIFRGLKEGDWRMRAKYAEEHGRWSRWHDVSVAGRVKIQPLREKPVQKQVMKPAVKQKTALVPRIILPGRNSNHKASTAITFKVNHGKNMSIQYAFQYRQTPGSGAFSPLRVNTSSLTRRAGKTVGSLRFDNPGEYRFRTRKKGVGTSWSNWSTFMVTANSRPVMRVPKKPINSLKTVQ